MGKSRKTVPEAQKADKAKSRTKNDKKTKSQERLHFQALVSVGAEDIGPPDQISRIKEALSSNQLDDHMITELMLHCASVLAFRRSQATGLKEKSSPVDGSCYKGVGGSDQVTIWSNGFAVETCSRQEARDRGIPACG